MADPRRIRLSDPEYALDPLQLTSAVFVDPERVRKRRALFLKAMAVRDRRAARRGGRDGGAPAALPGRARVRPAEPAGHRLRRDQRRGVARGGGRHPRVRLALGRPLRAAERAGQVCEIMHDGSFQRAQDALPTVVCALMQNLSPADQAALDTVTGNGYEPPAAGGGLTSDTSFASTGLPQTPQTPDPSSGGSG